MFCWHNEKWTFICVFNNINEFYFDLHFQKKIPVLNQSFLVLNQVFFLRFWHQFSGIFPYFFPSSNTARPEKQQILGSQIPMPILGLGFSKMKALFSFNTHSPDDVVVAVMHIPSDFALNLPMHAGFIDFEGSIRMLRYHWPMIKLDSWSVNWSLTSSADKSRCMPTSQSTEVLSFYLACWPFLYIIPLFSAWKYPPTPGLLTDWLTGVTDWLVFSKYVFFKVTPALENFLGTFPMGILGI